jgi:hypothetical protein
MKVSLAYVTVLFLALPFATGVAQGSSACAPSDSISLRVRQRFAYMASGTDGTASALRTMYHVPQAADSAVVLVQDSHVCSSALSALNKDENASHAQGQRTVVVVSIGNVYVVHDPNEHVGEWQSYTIFDGSFRSVLARVAG